MDVDKQIRGPAGRGRFLGAVFVETADGDGARSGGRLLQQPAVDGQVHDAHRGVRQCHTAISRLPPSAGTAAARARRLSMPQCGA
ncbi:hypothetical protein ABT063_27110 [Streptomyces sp. NPDC002838]|uniref:hypothetical protein n=1 Tax=Streptomyces sp. NPDC002838 TaxID=3154436 RepID=UPI00332CEC68